MISLYTGTPGSGKSLDIARMIYLKLRMGHTVIGNMRIKPEKVKNCRGKYIFVDTYHMNPYDFIRYAERYHKKGKESQTFIVIDECQQIFNSRDWADKGRRAWNEFFQVHRHYGFSVWLITQYDRLIDRQLRALVEYNYVHRKVSNFGFKGRLVSLLFRGGLFVKVSEWYPVHESTGSEFFIYMKKYGSFYDSYAAFSDDETVIFDELKPLVSPAVARAGEGGTRESSAG
jgi:zona occludens toxin (predicted ATPase)